MAAILDTGGVAVISGFAALALWGVPGFAPEVITVLALRGTNRRFTPLATIRQSNALVKEHAVRRNGIAVLVPTRLAFDIAYDVHPKRLEFVLNYFGKFGWTDGVSLEAMAGELRRRGRAGSAVMGELLRGRFGPGWKAAESNLELRFEDIIVRAGFPRPRRQVDVGNDHTWIGRRDFKDPDLPLIGEVQSDLHHIAPLDAADDADRRARLEAAGFVVVEIRERDVWHDARLVCRKWGDGRRLAREKRH